MLSFVRVAPTADLLNQVRIDTQQADVLLACDMVVGASADALSTVKHGRTEVLANTHELATAAFVRNPDASLEAAALLAKLRHAAGDERVQTLDAQELAQRMMGDTMPSNIVMLGAAYQRGLVPLSEAALMRAVELNGVAVEANKTAFALGRLAAVDPVAVHRLSGAGAMGGAAAATLFGPGGLVARRIEFLTAYQDAALARRYRELIEAVHERELGLRFGETGSSTVATGSGPSGAATPLTDAVARNFAKLLAVKDEYEVARLYVDGSFERALAEQFDSVGTIHFHMAPPLLSRPGPDGRPRKLKLGPWLMPAMRLLARARGLRGHWLDPFGHTQERKLERCLANDYEALLRDTLLPALNATNHPAAVALASLPERIRGYGHVKLASVVTAKAQQQVLLGAFAGRQPATPTLRESRPVIPIVHAD